MHRRNFRAPLVAAAALAALLVSATGAEAGGKKKPANDKRLVTKRLFDLDWHADWKAAVVKNRIEPKGARPIFFLRILGDLAEKT